MSPLLAVALLGPAVAAAGFALNIATLIVGLTAPRAGSEPGDLIEEAVRAERRATLLQRMARAGRALLIAGTLLFFLSAAILGYLAVRR